jgi:hypothetical protein
MCARSTGSCVDTGDACVFIAFVHQVKSMSGERQWWYMAEAVKLVNHVLKKYTLGSTMCPRCGMLGPSSQTGDSDVRAHDVMEHRCDVSDHLLYVRLALA